MAARQAKTPKPTAYCITRIQRGAVGGKSPSGRHIAGERAGDHGDAAEQEGEPGAEGDPERIVRVLAVRRRQQAERDQDEISRRRDRKLLRPR